MRKKKTDAQKAEFYRSAYEQELESKQPKIRVLEILLDLWKKYVWRLLNKRDYKESKDGPAGNTNRKGGPSSSD